MPTLVDLVGKDIWDIIMDYKWELERVKRVKFYKKLCKRSIHSIVDDTEIFTYFSHDATKTLRIRTRIFNEYGDMISPGEFKDVLLEAEQLIIERAWKRWKRRKLHQ